MAGMEPAPWDISWLMTGPLAMITGRKKISRKTPFPLILEFSSRAMINANTTMIGVAMIVFIR